jgi:hypothetical protein
MRTRSLVVAALMAPLVLNGQTVRRGGRVAAGGQSPASPKPLPPQNAQVADDIYAKQSRSYMVSYPMLSYVNAPGYDAQKSTWVTYGGGTSLGFMLKPNLAMTGDLVSTDFGGPQKLQSVQIGWRYWPSQDYERKLNPFLDGRGGYSLAYETYATQIPGSIASAPRYYHDSRLTNGFGIVGGAGFEYPLWSNFTLATEMLAQRSRLTTMHSTAASNNPYSMTQYSLAIGVSYSMIARRAMTYRARAKNRVLK